MTPQSVRNPVCQFALIGVLATFLAWTTSHPTFAQKGGGIEKAEVMKLLREQSLPESQAEAFQTYFQNELLAHFRSSAGASHDKFFKLRGQLKIFLNTGRTGPAHAELNRLALKEMKSIVASPKYDYGAKVNAMYVIGDLNADDTPGSLKPLPEAFSVMLTVVQSPKFKDALKVPALVGLERFAAADAIPAESRGSLAKTMLDLVNQKTPPADRPADAHEWLRRGAAHVLAAMGSPGPNNAVVTAFTQIIADPEARPTLRCEVAQLLGRLKFPPGAKVDMQSLANLVGHQTVEITSRELERAQVRKQTPSMRVVVYALYSARESLAGLAAAAGDSPQAQPVADLHEKVKRMHAELDDPKITDEGVEPEVRRRITDLENSLAPKASPAAKEEVAAAGSRGEPAQPAAK